MSSSIVGKRTYQVKRGDTLWGIAKSQYGDGMLWASIAKENTLASPDVLFVGQSLSLSNKPLTARANIPISPLLSRSVAKTVTLPSYEFEFPKTENAPPIYFGPVKVTIKLEGKLIFQKKGAVSNITIKNLKELEASSKSEIANNVQSLITEMKFTFDPEKKTLKASGGLASVLKLPGGGEIKNEVSFEGKKITFSAKVSKVSGTYKDMAIEGTFGYEISFECDDFMMVAPARVRLPNIQIDWNKVVVITVVAVGVTAALVLVAKILPYIMSAAVITAVMAIPFLTAWQMLNQRVPLTSGKLL